MYTYEEVKQIFESKNCRLLSMEYKNGNQKLDYICSCGRKSSSTFYSFKASKGCKYCRYDRKPKLTYNEVYEHFEECGCKLLSKDYLGVKHKLEYICSCGNRDTKTFGNFLQGQRCKQCGNDKASKSRIIPYEKILEEFNKSNCGLLTTKEEYINAQYKLDYICECGNKSSIHWSHFKNGKRCWKCRNEKIADHKRLDFKFIDDYFLSKGGYLITPFYINNHQKLEYICSKGHVSTTSFARFQSGIGCMQCYLESLKGSGNPAWNPNKTDEERLRDRSGEEYENWRKEVFERDNYTCQICGKKGDLNAHHLDGYSWCKEKRYEESNGVTLCVNCHKEFHKKFKKINNTVMQFDKFKMSKLSLGQIGGSSICF